MDLEKQAKFLQYRAEGYSLTLSMNLAGIIGHKKVHAFMRTEVYKQEQIKYKAAFNLRNNSLISIAAKRGWE